ncbi:hypothetical protein NYQ25_18415 [Curtobacterium flaccumfaciens pv. flaccumfaciens]|nr:hypothetical protein [Curtobacterium flaccumfaciens]MCS6586947.1 hypothetical protein [Curtobacterium flaccumfaciens pv. flaccumfaciens]
MSDASHSEDSTSDAEVTDPMDVDPTDGTDEDDMPVDNPAG